MGSIQRWDVWSYYDHTSMNQLFVTIRDCGNLKSPNPSSQEPWKMYLIKYNMPKQNKFLHPLSSLVHLMQFHPLNQHLRVSKEISLTFVSLATERRDLGRIQLPVENRGARIYHQVLKDSLKEARDKSQYWLPAVLSWRAMELLKGAEREFHQCSSIRCSPSLSVLSLGKAGSRSHPFYGWIRAGSHCLPLRACRVAAVSRSCRSYSCFWLTTYQLIRQAQKNSFILEFQERTKKIIKCVQGIPFLLTRTKSLLSQGSSQAQLHGHVTRARALSPKLKRTSALHLTLCCCHGEIHKFPTRGPAFSSYTAVHLQNDIAGPVFCRTWRKQNLLAYLWPEHFLQVTGL